MTYVIVGRSEILRVSRESVHCLKNYIPQNSTKHTVGDIRSLNDDLPKREFEFPSVKAHPATFADVG